MSIRQKVNINLGVIFALVATVAITFFVLAQSTATAMTDYRDRTDVLQTTMWSLRADFYNYDDQMNMYVAVMVGESGQKDLAETTYQQAAAARAQMAQDLDRADRLASGARLAGLLARVRQDYVGYNGFADQTRAAGLAGDHKRAVYLATVGNLQPSNDMMPTLDAARAAVTKTVGAELARMVRRQRVMETVAVSFGTFIVLAVLALSTGLNVFMLRPVAALRDRMSGIASGAIARSERLAVTGEDELAQVARAFNGMLDSLHEQEEAAALEHARREADTKASAERTRAAERSVRERAQEAIVTSSAQVIDELHQVMAEVDAVQASTGVIDERVVATGVRTRDAVRQATEADQVAAALGESLRKVGGMTQLIAGVAGQTKLLALNATIEAARAGEAGQGFSVVAGEVKDLATTTTQSTAEIASTISSLEGNAAAMAHAIGGMSEGIAGMEAATSTLSGVAEEQRQVVETLRGRVADAIDRIESMADLNGQIERRGNPRAFLPGQVRLAHGGRTVDAGLIDLSVSGLRCRVEAATAPRSGVVEVTLPAGGHELRLEAHVLRTRDTAVGEVEIGLEFAGVRDADRAVLAAEVQSMAAA